MIRLNKWIASQGVCSRREADRLIAAGKVIVNGAVETSLGRKIDPRADKVEYAFDKEEFRAEKTTVAFHKPAGYVVTASEEEGPNIYELTGGLPDHVRPVGRLDKDSSGLIILTDDSSLPQKIIGETSVCEKEYFVKTVVPIPDGSLEKLRGGVRIMGEMTRRARIDRMSADSFHMTIVEGKNRQIRRMCRKVGAPVETLIRVRIGTVRLDGIEPGQWRKLDDKEIEYFRNL
jgi:pseudouridine synthase